MLNKKYISIRLTILVVVMINSFQYKSFGWTSEISGVYIESPTQDRDVHLDSIMVNMLLDRQQQSVTETIYDYNVLKRLQYRCLRALYAYCRAYTDNDSLKIMLYQKNGLDYGSLDEKLDDEFLEDSIKNKYISFFNECPVTYQPQQQDITYDNLKQILSDNTAMAFITICMDVLYDIRIAAEAFICSKENPDGLIRVAFGYEFKLRLRDYKDPDNALKIARGLLDYYTSGNRVELFVLPDGFMFWGFLSNFEWEIYRIFPAVIETFDLSKIKSVQNFFGHFINP